ncbi:class F sortase [Bacillus sp. JJ1122]
MLKALLSIIIMIAFLAGCNAAGGDTIKKASATDELNKSQQEKEKESVPSQMVSGTQPANSISSNGKVISESIKSIDPYRLQIPSIDVDTLIENVGLLDNGQMGVPESFETVGWYERGPKPGERGNAVLAGHVDSKKGPAVFFYLKKLKEGDEVIISDKRGKSLTYKVKGVKSYPTELSPVNEIFDYSYQSNLNLITCTGIYDRTTGNHSERLVVYTSLK